jgi:glutamate synthase (NADPH/NADH) small chain
VCLRGCPLGINIPRFIRHLREGDVAGAYQVIKEESVLPSICGRICSAPCEAACVLNDEKAPIGIRGLERYVSDYGRSKPPKIEASKGKKVAVIGSGPAGLTAAAFLAKKGCQVTVFESLDLPGGVLRYGIPEFRIPKKVLDAQIDDIKALGVEFRTNVFIGQTITLLELKQQGFAGVLLALGAGVPKFMDLKGANLGGVYYGEEFLMRVNLGKPGTFGKSGRDFIVGNKVVVIGSGNTALDCARSARRFAKDVRLVFRRPEEQMRVSDEEREFAKAEGVQLEPLVKPLEIIAKQDDFVGGLKCIRIDYADTNGNNQWELMPVPGSEFTLEADTVVIAIGHRPNSILAKFDERLVLNRDGTVKIDQHHMTSIDGVFACGNIVTNAGPVVEAMASGKKAAESLGAYMAR